VWWNILTGASPSEKRLQQNLEIKTEGLVLRVVELESFDLFGQHPSRLLIGRCRSGRGAEVERPAVLRGVPRERREVGQPDKAQSTGKDTRELEKPFRHTAGRGFPAEEPQNLKRKYTSPA